MTAHTSLSYPFNDCLGNLVSIDGKNFQCFKQCCITLGQEISLVQGDSVTHGTALDIDPDGALVVRLTDGSIQTVSFGEVSIRGMYGYV